MPNPKEGQERAEAQFHKTLKKTHEAKQAMSQYEADARAVNEKTARLRALRIAKETAEAKAAAESKPEKKKKSAAKKPAGASSKEVA